MNKRLSLDLGMTWMMDKHTGRGRKGSPSLFVEVLYNKVSFWVKGLVITLHHCTVLGFKGQRRKNDRIRWRSLIDDSRRQMGRSLRRNSFQKKNSIFLPLFTSQAIPRWHISHKPRKMTLREPGCTRSLWFALTEKAHGSRDYAQASHWGISMWGYISKGQVPVYGAWYMLTALLETKWSFIWVTHNCTERADLPGILRVSY